MNTAPADEAVAGDNAKLVLEGVSKTFPAAGGESIVAVQDISFSVARNENYALPDGIRPSLTPRLVAASHNNYYEFLPGRGGDAWPFTKDFEIDPWKVEVGGECRRPATLSPTFVTRCLSIGAVRLYWRAETSTSRIRPSAPSSRIVPGSTT